MSARSRLTAESFIEALRLRVPHFVEINPTHQVKMAYFISMAGTKGRTHKTQAGNSSFGKHELDNAFGKGEFKVLNDRLGIFEVDHHYSKANHITKGYRLTEHVQNIKERFELIDPVLPNEATSLVSFDGRKITRLPNVLASKDTAGNTATAWSGIPITALVPVNVTAICDVQRRLNLAMLACMSEGRLTTEVDEHFEIRIRSAGQINEMSNTDVAGYGFILHRFVEQKAGRIGGQGISLQGAPREVRSAALCGNYDYDIENCHYAIFRHLSLQFGVPCPAIDHYLANKSAIRSGIAKRVGISIKQTKNCLLMIMYGSPLSPREENAIPEEIGVEKAKVLYKDEEFVAIADDIRAGRKQILAKWPDRTRSYLMNAMGKSVKLTETPAIKLAHLLQGIEANALRAVLRTFGTVIILPIHDGFVSSVKLDVDRVEKVLLEATGIALEVSEQQILAPTIHDLHIH